VIFEQIKQLGATFLARDENQPKSACPFLHNFLPPSENFKEAEAVALCSQTMLYK
jgi:hypothetical protein